MAVRVHDAKTRLWRISSGLLQQCELLCYNSLAHWHKLVGSIVPATINFAAVVILTSYTFRTCRFCHCGNCFNKQNININIPVFILDNKKIAIFKKLLEESEYESFTTQNYFGNAYYGLSLDFSCYLDLPFPIWIPYSCIHQAWYIQRARNTKKKINDIMHVQIQNSTVM